MSDSYKYYSLTTIFLLLFIIGTSFQYNNAFAQNDPELIAKGLFENGDYGKALPYFKDLVILYPKDEMLNYYYAACLVETKAFTEETKIALQNAFGEQSPAKVFYYQAQDFHADNNFEMALNFYQRFLDEGKRKTINNTQVNQLIKQCKQGINPFPKNIPVKTSEVAVLADTTPTQATKPTPKIKIPIALQDSLINFQITPNIHYLKINHFKDETSVQSFIKGWKLEQEINKLLAEANTLRSQYSSASINEKQELAETIPQLEKEVYEQNKQVNNYYLDARKKEVEYWKNADNQEINSFKLTITNIEDSLQNIKKEASIQIVNTKEQALPVQIITDTQKTKSQTNQLVYKIQIGAYRNTPPDWVQKLFKKLSVIRKIDQYTDEKGVTVYTVGELSSFQDALQMQSQVRQEGVKDAFVAAYKNNERISVAEARKISEKKE